MRFVLKELPYSKDALEPFLSKRTVDFHYEKHHKGYINKINNKIENTQFEDRTIEEIIQTADGGIYNNAAQAWNHTFFWDCFTPKSGMKPAGAILEAITQNFGTINDFREKFSEEAATLFGSGWIWLVKKDDGNLDIIKGQNAYNPLRDKKVPILTIDMWEHAYYLDYQNEKKKYIENFWEFINWNSLNLRYEYHEVTGKLSKPIL